jgi:hypothetical protein
MLENVFLIPALNEVLQKRRRNSCEVWRPKVPPIRATARQSRHFRLAVAEQIAKRFFAGSGALVVGKIRKVLRLSK